MGSRKRTLEQRLTAGEPKRILSIDGGGMRAILAAGILTEVERRLALRSGRPDFRLCEYFDLIGGTSTGAVVAAGLAAGASCADIVGLLREIAPDPAPAPKGRGANVRRARFDSVRLEGALARVLGDAELSSPALRTCLAVFAKRVDTGAAWTLTNNPRSKHWNGDAGAAPHKRLVVRKLVQASAAAPTLFEEMRVKLDQDNALVPGAEGLFVDGAVAGLNNPALQLFKLATLKSYGFEWPSGEDQILMLSVGAGYWRPKLDSAVGKPFEESSSAAVRAVEALRSLIHDTGVTTVATMQALSRPPRPWRIDGDVEEMQSDHLSPFPLLSFQRLDVPLEREALQTLSIECTDAELAALRDGAGDDGAVLARLHDIGLRAGQSYFRTAARTPRDWEREILPPRFDPAFFSERSHGQPRTRLDAMGRLFERPPGPGE